MSRFGCPRLEPSCSGPSISKNGCGARGPIAQLARCQCDRARGPERARIGLRRLGGRHGTLEPLHGLGRVAHNRMSRYPVERRTPEIHRAGSPGAARWPFAGRRVTSRPKGRGRTRAVAGGTDSNGARSHSPGWRKAACDSRIAEKHVELVKILGSCGRQLAWPERRLRTPH